MAVACLQTASMIDLDHVSVAAFPAGFRDDATRRGKDLIAAFAIDIHSAVKLIRTTAKRAATKSELVIDLAHVSPNRGNGRLIARCLDGAKLLFDFGIFGVHFSEAQRSAAISCVDI